jgi:hypothetical protein
VDTHRSKLIVGVQQVRASDRNGLLRVTLRGRMLDVEHGGLRATLIVDDGEQMHRHAQLPTTRTDEDAELVSVAFAVPLDQLARQRGLELALNGAPPLPLPTPDPGPELAVDAIARTDAEDLQGQPRAPLDQLAARRSARISELELALQQARSSLESQEAARREAERQTREVQDALRDLRGVSTEQIRTLQSRCEELEGTLSDVLRELEAMADSRRGRGSLPTTAAARSGPAANHRTPEQEPAAPPA